MSFGYDPMSGRQVHPEPGTLVWPAYVHRHGWPAMPDPIAECAECGKDFEPSEPDTDGWCPSCAGADRWDNP